MEVLQVEDMVPTSLYSREFVREDTCVIEHNYGEYEFKVHSNTAESAVAFFKKALRC